MKNLINRKEYLEKLLSYKDKDLIKVVTGLRRAGKSSLLELFRNNLLENGVTAEQTQFYNFELPENFLNKNRKINGFKQSPNMGILLERKLV